MTTTLEARAEAMSWRATAAQLARVEAPVSRLMRDAANCRARELAHVSETMAEVYRDRAKFFGEEAERLERLAMEMVEER